MTENRLKLNAEKQSVLLLADKGSVINKNVFLIPLLNRIVMPAVSTRNLGVIFDDKFRRNRTRVRPNMYQKITIISSRIQHCTHLTNDAARL